MYNFLVLSLCTGSEDENGARTFDEPCGDAQDLSSPDKKMRLYYLTLVVSLVNCHIYRLLFEIALLRVCAQIRIG